MVKHRDLIDAIADRVTITDLQGKILDVNQAVLDFSRARPRGARRPQFPRHGRGRRTVK